MSLRWLPEFLRRFSSSPKPRRTKRGRVRSFRPELTVLEDRCVPSVTNIITVTGNGDDTGILSAKPFPNLYQDTTLRGAIAASNSMDPGAGNSNEINFNIGSGGAQTILVGSTGLGGLPAVNVAVPLMIDATTQPGFFAKPIIQINGQFAGAASGLVINAGASSVLGLVINGFAQEGIDLFGYGALVQGNYIGTDPTGTQAVPNLYGISILHNGMTINGNLISGNTRSGISFGIASGVEGGNMSGTVVEGNYIGTTADGTAPLGNAYGINLTGTSLGVENTIGGTTASTANLISGNTNSGILIDDGSTFGNGGFTASRYVVEGNLIGTDGTGTSALGNTNSGVTILGGSFSNTIQSNVISGNNATPNSSGVYLSGAGIANDINGNKIGITGDASAKVPNSYGVFIRGTSETFVEGNIIGGNTSSGIFLVGGATQSFIAGNDIGNDGLTSTPLGNGGNGIYILNSPGNDVRGNVIAGNKGPSCILISGAGSHDNGVIYQNYLGFLPNLTPLSVISTYGVYIANAPNNFIGQDALTGKNFISGNAVSGVLISGSQATGNVVGYNFIGVQYNAGTFAPLPNVYGVFLSAPGNTIVGNTISGNTNSGIYLTGIATGNTVLGNNIGTERTGTKAIPNLYGIRISSASGNTIGGTAAGNANVISGNSNSNIYISGNSSNNVILGNLIGTNGAGTAALGASLYGLYITSAGNTIGGLTFGAGNTISGNGQGILLSGSGATGNVIQGNFIGTDSNGFMAIPNTNGIWCNGAGGNTIGGIAAGAANTISGNKTAGVYLTGSGANLIEGNFIGTDSSGTLALGNVYGVRTLNGGNTIGGTTPAAANVISGNNQGVVLSGSTATANLVEGNFIGTDGTGTTAVANTLYGVAIISASGNIIGGSVAGAGNVISGNTTGSAGTGVYITGSGNLVAGNLIGTDAAGGTPLPNYNGIYITGAGNTVGGTTTFAVNVISANAHYGVYLSGSGANHNVVEGNNIGTNATGDAALANAYGIFLSNAPSNIIGGTSSGTRNLISGNTSAGVYLSGSGATTNLIQGNYIGTDSSGSTALANAYGVYVVGAPGNTIGGTTAAARNLISGNVSAAVRLSGSGSTGNQVLGNYLGTDAGGTVKVANRYGVYIDTAAGNNTIGGTVSGAGNLIAFNTSYGVDVTSGTGNSILMNSLFSNSLGNIFLAAGANHNQAAPVLTAATSAGGTVTGNLATTSGHQYRIEFFSSSTSGQAAQFLGFLTLTAGGSSSTISMSGLSFAVGSYITGTATDLTTADTSVLSNAVKAT